MDFTELTFAMLTPEQVRNIRLRLDDLELAFEAESGETPARRAAAERRGWKVVDAAHAFNDDDPEGQAAMEATLDKDVAARYGALPFGTERARSERARAKDKVLDDGIAERRFREQFEAISDEVLPF